ncbi:hypothetical protein Lal_00049447 [Lupinus albus]|nr:hypothetical protein Lal_00049447 [Lupinus albus]
MMKRSEVCILKSHRKRVDSDSERCPERFLAQNLKENLIWFNPPQYINLIRQGRSNSHMNDTMDLSNQSPDLTGQDLSAMIRPYESKSCFVGWPLEILGQS